MRQGPHHVAQKSTRHFPSASAASKYSSFRCSIAIIIGSNFSGSPANNNEPIQSLLISKPVETFYSKPAEDLEQLHQEVDRIKEEAELKQRQQEKMSDEAQRKLLIRMGVVAVVVIVVFVAVLVGIKMMQPEELHHTVQIVAPNS